MSEPTCPHCCIPLSEHPAHRCLDAWAAECAGWKWYRTDGDFGKWRGPNGECDLPCFSTDIAAALRLEAKIEKAGKVAAYVDAMRWLTRPRPEVPEMPGCGQVFSIDWRRIHASPETRTKAYIAAMTKEKEHRDD